MNPLSMKDGDFETALEKMRAYCSYSERCNSEVFLRLGKFMLTTNEKNRIIELLEEEGFLNSKRYLSVFVRGKLIHNHWGKIKIKYELRAKGFSDNEINDALATIDQDEYNLLVKKLISNLKTQKAVGGDLSRKEKEKVIRAMMAKGFEYDLIRTYFTEELDIDN